MDPRPPPPQYSPMTSMTLLTPDYLFLSMATYPTTCISIIMGMICGALGVCCRPHVVLGVIYWSQVGRGDPTSDDYFHSDNF